LGLHTWLPDAMEGPTPVSALIHAATMVTAGVFMVCRLSPMFVVSPTAMMVVTYVGAATALFAATVALTQTDIKRVIAYSTCSQLGYMFFAAGVGAFNGAMILFERRDHRGDVRERYPARLCRLYGCGLCGVADQFLLLAADVPDILGHATLGRQRTHPSRRAPRPPVRRTWR